MAGKSGGSDAGIAIMALFLVMGVWASVEGLFGGGHDAPNETTAVASGDPIPQEVKDAADGVLGVGGKVAEGAQKAADAAQGGLGGQNTQNPPEAAKNNDQDAAPSAPLPEDPASVVAGLADRFAAEGILGPGGVSAADAAVATSALTGLKVAPESPSTGFDRGPFDFRDVDKNGCSTRNDLLNRDLNPATVVYTPDDTKNCEVAEGTMPWEPYVGRVDRKFVAGANNMSLALDVEHVVSLKEAWESGAWAWDATTRRAYGNDPIVTIMADASQNRSHGDRDAAEWLPPNTAFHCEYAVHNVVIKAVYDLSVDQAEHDALARALKTCPA